MNKLLSVLFATAMSTSLFASVSATMQVLPTIGNVSTSTPLTSGSTSFSDVSVSDWHYPYISSASNAGLISGYTDGTFRPNDNVSYDEFSVMLSNAFLSLDLQTNIASHTGSDWSTPYTTTVMNAYSASNPNNTQILQSISEEVIMTRYGTAYMVAMQLELAGITVFEESTYKAKVNSTYYDVGDAIYPALVGATTYHNVMYGMSETYFCGNLTLTRAEAAVVLNALLYITDTSRYDAQKSTYTQFLTTLIPVISNAYADHEAYGLPSYLGYGGYSSGNVGYVFLDINGDGTLELLLGDMNNGSLLCGYTIVNNNITTFFTSGERYSATLNYLFYLAESGSSGAADSMVGISKLNTSGQLNYIAYLNYLNNGYYYVPCYSDYVDFSGMYLASSTQIAEFYSSFNDTYTPNYILLSNL